MAAVSHKPGTCSEMLARSRRSGTQERREEVRIRNPDWTSIYGPACLRVNGNRPGALSQGELLLARIPQSYIAYRPVALKAF